MHAALVGDAEESKAPSPVEASTPPAVRMPRTLTLETLQRWGEQGDSAAKTTAERIAARHAAEGIAKSSAMSDARDQPTFEPASGQHQREQHPQLAPDSPKPESRLQLGTEPELVLGSEPPPDPEPPEPQSEPQREGQSRPTDSAIALPQQLIYLELLRSKFPSDEVEAMIDVMRRVVGGAVGEKNLSDLDFDDILRQAGGATLGLKAFRRELGDLSSEDEEDGDQLPATPPSDEPQLQSTVAGDMHEPDLVTNGYRDNSSTDCHQSPPPDDAIVLRSYDRENPHHGAKPELLQPGMGLASDIQGVRGRRKQEPTEQLQPWVKFDVAQHEVNMHRLALDSNVPCPRIIEWVPASSGGTGSDPASYSHTPSRLTMQCLPGITAWNFWTDPADPRLLDDSLTHQQRFLIESEHVPAHVYAKVRVIVAHMVDVAGLDFPDLTGFNVMVDEAGQAAWIIDFEHAQPVGGRADCCDFTQAFLGGRDGWNADFA